MSRKWDSKETEDHSGKPSTPRFRGHVREYAQIEEEEPLSLEASFDLPRSSKRQMDARGLLGSKSALSSSIVRVSPRVTAMD